MLHFVVKKKPVTTQIKVNEINGNTVKFIYVRDMQWHWTKIEHGRMHSQYLTLVGGQYSYMLIFLVEPEVEVYDNVGAKVFLALDMSRFEGSVGTMKKADRQMIVRKSEEIAVADAAMWSGLRASKYRNPMGCKTFLFELFAGAMLLSCLLYTSPSPRD